MSRMSEMQAPRPLVIVCLEDHPKAILLLLNARRRAQEKNMKWRAVFVETPTHMAQKDNGAHERMLQLLTQAEQMGGETEHIEAESIEKGLASLFDKEKGRIVSTIIGSAEAEQSSRLGLLYLAPWMRLARLASRYSQVEIVPLYGEPYPQSLREKLGLQNLRPRHFFYALVGVALAAAGGFFLESIFPASDNDHSIVLLFIIACAFIAGRFGLLPGLTASVAGFLTVSYYFTPPYYSLKIGAVTSMLNLGLFLCTALMISLLSSRSWEFAHKASRREIGTKALFTLYRIASTAFTREQALEKLHRKLERMLEMDVAFFLPHASPAGSIAPAFPADLALGDADTQALRTCWTEARAGGLAAPRDPGASWRFEPMIAPSGQIGVMGVRPRRREQLDAWFGQFLNAIADQTAAVLQHIDLERAMQEARLREERDQLRSILLSSVSHDFKTPLAGIIGALSVYRSLGDRLAPQKRTELIESAIEEAQRLDSFITNILDMTRLESSDIRFRKEWHSISTMVSEVAQRMRHRMRQHELVIHACDDIEVYADIMMTEQVIQNVLDNASKYTPAGTRIEITCTVDDKKGLLCEIRDHGPGLPLDRLGSLFDKYARLQKKDSQIAGTGLGLAIGKTIMETQGGSIVAANHPEGGAVFTLCLPQWRKSHPFYGESSEPTYEQANRSH